MWLEFIKAVEPKAELLVGVTESQLASLEKTLNISLPSELKSLLIETNGIRDEFGLRLIWSVEEIERHNLKMRTDPIFIDNYMPLIICYSLLMQVMGINLRLVLCKELSDDQIFLSGIMKMIAVPGSLPL